MINFGDHHNHPVWIYQNLYIWWSPNNSENKLWNGNLLDTLVRQPMYETINQLSIFSLICTKWRNKYRDSPELRYSHLKLVLWPYNDLKLPHKPGKISWKQQQNTGKKILIYTLPYLKDRKKVLIYMGNHRIHALIHT